MDKQILDEFTGSAHTLYRRLSHPYKTIWDKYQVVLRRIHKSRYDYVIDEKMFYEFMGLTERDYELAKIYGIELPTWNDVLSLDG